MAQKVDVSTLEPGILLHDRYRLDVELGSGSAGVVYRALDTHLGRPVAIKAFSPERVTDDALARFRREAMSLARLSHPGIVPIYDFAESDGLFYLALALIPGQDLWALLSEHQDILPLEASLTLCRNILDVLDYVHSQGVVHRDLKPENVMVTDEAFHICLTDFGLATISGMNRITRDGMIAGSAYYLAPEVISGEQADARSDLYALGVMLYELVTGRLPFQGDTPLLVIVQHHTAEPMPPTHLNPAVSSQLESIILRLLAKRPQDRFQTASDVLIALDDLEILADAGIKRPLPLKSPPAIERDWLLLTYQMPPNPSAPRVAIWRKLKRLGAVLLHESVWVLPATAQTREQFQWLAGEIVEAGGAASVWTGERLPGGQEIDIAAQFTEQADSLYRDILAKLEAPDADLPALASAYQSARQGDYFGSAAGEQVRAKLIQAREARRS